jgi:hypothetical protein
MVVSISGDQNTNKYGLLQAKLAESALIFWCFETPFSPERGWGEWKEMLKLRPKC